MDSSTTPIVTVIVPVYKVEHYVENCLNSLINQTLQNWEAILVDDGSPDRSGAICDEYAAKDSRFKVIHKENGGLSSARNAAIPYAKGKYFFFLDSDDFIHKDTLLSLTDMANNNKADIVQCGFMRGSDTVFPEIEEKGFRTYDNHSIFTSFAAKIITCGKLYGKSAIGDIRFPVGLINEDDFTTWKFYYKAKKIVVVDTPYYYYTINPQSIMANQQRKPNLNYFNAYRERIAFFNQTKEEDLEAISRVQWMKSLVMLYSNPQLTNDERKEVKTLFNENYHSASFNTIKIPSKLKFVFLVFSITPMLASKLVKRIYKAGV